MDTTMPTSTMIILLACASILPSRVFADGAVPVSETDSTSGIIPGDPRGSSRSPLPSIDEHAVVDSSEGSGVAAGDSKPAIVPARSRQEIGESKDWTVLLDFADIDGGSRVNQRHLRTRSASYNHCCFDAAWTPWHPSKKSSIGPVVDLGRWKQDLSDGTTVDVYDILVATGARYAKPGSGPWARFDLGVSTLVVKRRTKGADWGLGGSLRGGWRFDFGHWAAVCGGSWDFRKYVHLDMEDVPASTLFAGVEL